jgi:hypothetical protein
MNKLNKGSEGPLQQNYKILKKEIGEEIRQWKDPPCSCNRINIMKKSTLPKGIYMLNAIPSKFQ